MALIDIDSCLDFLSLDVKHRDKVDVLSGWVQARAESIIRRKLDKDDYTFYLDGVGNNKIQIPVIPINSTTGVYVDTDRTFATAEDTDDYYIDTDTGILTFYERSLLGFRIVKVVVNAGYDTDNFPSDMKLAFYEAIQWNLSRLKDRAFGVRDQSTPDGLTVGYEMVLPMGVQRVFESYKDML